MSLAEAAANVAVGYGVAVVTQMLVFPLFGFEATLKDNLAIGVIFTAISLGRSYAIRRLFEALVRSARGMAVHHHRTRSVRRRERRAEP